MAESPLVPHAPPRPGWALLQETPFDLLVVGGGIHGAGVARDAALRGLKVAVLDRGDWAGGTSSRSSKLMHGGLRYLRQGAFSLVRESLRERDRHLRLAPASVRRLRFEVPAPRLGGPPGWQVRAGIALYDVITRGASRAEPFGKRPAYDDAAIDDAGFCLEVLLDARRQGAVAQNYTEWLEWLEENGRLVGARIRDRVSGREACVRAAMCVNAAGPWAPELVSPRSPGTPLRLTRGTHVVLEGRLERAKLFFSPEDDRVLFLLPFGNRHALLGTTDLDEAIADPEPVPREEEIRYLARAFRRQFPRWSRWPAVGLQCGLRPLVAEEGPAGNVSREELLEEDPDSGLLSILGGKYTTYRSVAERVVDRVEETLRGRVTLRPTRSTRIPPRKRWLESGEDAARVFREEDAVRVEDVLLRRSRLGHLGSGEGPELEAALAGWTRQWGGGEEAAMAERTAFLELQRRRLGPLTCWEDRPGAA